MVGYIARRLLQGVFVMLGVSVVVFALTNLVGDPAALILPPSATSEQIEDFRHTQGFDRPVYVQYAHFLGNALTGNFGRSLVQNQDAMKLVLDHLGPSLELVAASIAVSLFIAIPLGILAALTRGTVVDYLSRGIALLGQCVPSFYLGIVLILFVSIRLRWLPSTGSPDIEGLILPAITLGAYSAAETMRLLRSSMLEVLSEDYMRTARAKGLSEINIVLRHGLKNAAIPVVTVMGLQINSLLGAAVVTETVFSYPGMGFLSVTAINTHDFIVIQAFVIVIALIVVVLNLIVDISYSLLDPRIVYSRPRGLLRGLAGLSLLRTGARINRRMRSV